MRIYDKTPDLSDPTYPQSADGFTPLCPGCLAPFPAQQGTGWWLCVKCGHDWPRRGTNRAQVRLPVDGG